MRGTAIHFGFSLVVFAAGCARGFQSQELVDDLETSGSAGSIARSRLTLSNQSSGTAADEQVCIGSGTGEKIQTELNRVGPIMRPVILCPDSVFELHNALEFKADGQVILTANSDGSVAASERRAQLFVADDNSSGIAITGSGFSNLKILSLVINGGRFPAGEEQKVDGDFKPHASLVELGGGDGLATGFDIRGNTFFNTRGWSTLHLVHCQDATVSFNDILNGGNQTHRADGISFECFDSTISKNRIENVTDGGIVLFGARGTRVEGNQISAIDRTMLGGINLVDNKNGFNDLTGVVVVNNEISSPNENMSDPKKAILLKVGIGVGGNIWWASNQQPVTGLTVDRNSFFGGNFFSAVAVNGAGNIQLETQSFDGSLMCQFACFGIKVNRESSRFGNLSGSGIATQNNKIDFEHSWFEFKDNDFPSALIEAPVSAHRQRPNTHGLPAADVPPPPPTPTPTAIPTPQPQQTPVPQQTEPAETRQVRVEESPFEAKPKGGFKIDVGDASLKLEDGTKLKLRLNGTLAVLRGPTELFSTTTQQNCLPAQPASALLAATTANCTAQFQEDGNLVLSHRAEDGHWEAYWSSRTEGRGETLLFNKSNYPVLAIVNAQSELIWPLQ